MTKRSAVAARVLLAALILAIPLGCSVASPGAPTQVASAGGAPTLRVDPLTASLLTVGQPITVVAHGTDSVGVARLDLRVGDVIVDTVSAPTAGGVPQLDAQLSWTPTAPGPIALVVIAYRGDGTPSAPATLAATVTDPSTATASPAASAPMESASPSEVAVVPTSPPPATANPTPAVTASPTPRRTPRPTPRVTPPATPVPATPAPTPELPNLRIVGLYVYNGVEPGERSIYIEVSNVGTVATGPFIVTLGYSSSAGGDGGFKAEQFPDGLPPRATVQVIMSKTFDPGTYTFTATADADEQVTESRENDNERMETEVVD